VSFASKGCEARKDLRQSHCRCNREPAGTHQPLEALLQQNRSLEVALLALIVNSSCSCSVRLSTCFSRRAPEGCAAEIAAEAAGGGEAQA